MAHLKPKETSGIFRKFYENFAQSLVYKLPAQPKIFTMETTKEYYDEFDIQNSLNLEMVDSSII